MRIMPRARYWKNSINNHVKGVDVFCSVKWTVRIRSLKLCAHFLVLAENFEVLQAHFLQKV